MRRRNFVGGLQLETNPNQGPNADAIYLLSYLEARAAHICVASIQLSDVLKPLHLKVVFGKKSFSKRWFFRKAAQASRKGFIMCAHERCAKGPQSFVCSFACVTASRW